ncbi:MAG: hypothetical protein IJR52_05735, partial [Selenomonadaceae bacterium]|nr:hypothetical protein [Selenomonadaceae bacterium]
MNQKDEPDNRAWLFILHREMNFEAVMDDGLARVMSVTRIQRARRARVVLTFKPRTSSRPREAPFSFASFLLGEQKKRRFKIQKRIENRDRRNAAVNNSFCVSTLTLRGEYQRTMCAMTKPTQQPLMTPIRPGI